MSKKSVISREVGTLIEIELQLSSEMAEWSTLYFSEMSFPTKNHEENLIAYSNQYAEMTEARNQVRKELLLRVNDPCLLPPEKQEITNPIARFFLNFFSLFKSSDSVKSLKKS